MSEYSVTIEISGTDKNSVESFLNTVHKQVDEGRRRYGVDLDVERVEQQDDEGGFEKANE